jgi:hypothetical protein
VKKQVSISIRKDVAEQAHQLGINISKVSENHLIFLIETIKNAHNKEMAGPMGFEPMTFSLEAWTGTAADWNRFRVWLESKHYAPRHLTSLFNYAVKYSDCLFKNDLTKLQGKPKSFQKNVMTALSSLAKFTGKYEDWKGIIKQHGLVWTGADKDQVFINRLEGVRDSGEIWGWIKESKEVYPDLTPLLDLMSVTGLRFIEGINANNLLLDLKSQGKLGSYYFEEKGTLEHYHFAELFLRSTKKAFVSFVTPNVVASVLQGKKLSANSVQDRFSGHGLRARFGDIREAHATFMTKFLKAPEIDFLHGRVTSSVFMANYFNPSLIADLQARAFQGIAEIQAKIG